MKPILLILACILLLGTSRMQAEISGHISQKEFITIPTGTVLNLPQFDLALTIPPNVSFALPVMYGENVAMNLGDQTFYNWDPQYFTDDNVSIFYFARRGEQNNPLCLTIKESTDETEKALETKSEKDLIAYKCKKMYVNQEELISPIKTNIGNSFSYKTVDSNSLIEDGTEDETTYYHKFYYKGYEFYFMYRSVNDKTKDEVFESIVKSISKKNLSQERDIYEQRAKNNFYNPTKHSKINIDEYIEAEFHTEKGVLEANTRFSYPELGISLELPQGMKSEISGRSILSKADGLVEIKVNDADFYNERSIQGFFFSNDFNIITGISKNDLKNVDIENSNRMMIESSRYHQFAKGTIGSDQIPVTVLFAGTETTGKMSLYFEKDGYTYQINVLGYNLRSRDAVDRVLRSLRVDGDAKLNEDPSTFIQLEKPDTSNFDTITLLQPNLEGSSEIKFADFGASVHLPGNIAEYSIIMGAKSPDLSSDLVIRNLSELGNEAFMLQDEKFTTVLYIAKAEQPTDLAENLALDRDGLNSLSYININKTGIVTINGIQWSVLSSNRDKFYTASASTFMNGYIVLFSFNSNNSMAEAEDGLAYLNTFKINKK